MEKEERIRIIKESFSSLRARRIVATQGDFAALLGISAKSLSAAKNGDDRYCTDSLADRILALMTQMEQGSNNAETAQNTEPHYTVKLIPTRARGGCEGDFSEAVMAHECETIISPIKGADYAIQVTGDSMAPEYPNGSMVLIKKVNEKAFIEWGKVYVLNTPNGTVIKQIRKSADPTMIECVSLNKDYESFEVPKDFITEWYRVLMLLSLK